MAGGFIGGKAWKKMMAKVYGLGAAIVIVGAMFKIQHWPGAGPMLVAGLTIEALIFAFSAFEPPHEEVDWSLVYPELAGMHGDDPSHAIESKEEPAQVGSVTEQLDHMLEEAKIGPELIESLGAGLRNLSENATKLSDISEATAATSEYVDNMKGASKSVETLSNTYNQASSAVLSSSQDLASSYSKATQALESFSASNQGSFEEARNYGEQLQKVSQNLSSLNASYELQLQGSNDHLKATSQLYSGIESLMKNLHESVEDTKRYKNEIAQLTSNLEALNTVYGNMLTALNYKK
ncbi:MAG: gliding motility protein GldL [Bacteroidetes bacterium]|nr:gliding motility protein GldL [Bacteroidota bacterium]